MVQLNLALREINCKIVYFGPGLSGKTTNLEVVHQKAPESSKGDLTSIATESDRTLFFDFMPLNLGTVSGMKTKFQLYTVPGQVYYNSTRKLVLRGADGVVFVADSSAAKMDENVESLENLQECLEDQGRTLSDTPHVLQWNKRDLDDAMSPEELEKLLNHHGAPCVEAIASKGDGVIETFKALSGLVLEKVKNLAEERKATARRPSPAPPTKPAQNESSGFRIQSNAPPAADKETSREEPRSKPSVRAPAASARQAPPRSAPAPAPRREREPSSVAVASRSEPRRRERPNRPPASMPRSADPARRRGQTSQRMMVVSSNNSRRKNTGVNPMVWVAMAALVAGGVAFALWKGIL